MTFITHNAQGIYESPIFKVLINTLGQLLQMEDCEVKHSLLLYSRTNAYSRNQGQTYSLLVSVGFNPVIKVAINCI